MKLKVLKPFINKENKTQIFNAGETIEIDDVARINDIVKRGLGEVIVEQPEAEPKSTPVDEPKQSKAKSKKEKQPADETPAEVVTATEQPAAGETDPAESEGTDEKEE